jgi:hypothetical protein
MTRSAHATFVTKSWDEKPYGVVEGAPNLTRASVGNAYSGAIEGEGTLEYLMVYRTDGSATFVGVERIVGRLDGQEGSFVLQQSGVYEDGAARAAMSVVPGSGTGALRGLRGEGSFVARHGEPSGTLTLDYELE